MVIKISGKTVVDNLFQNYHEMINQIFISSWIDLDLVLEIVKGASHNTWVLVTEGFFHFLIHLLNRGNLMEFEQNHYSFFPNHLMLMVQQPHNLLIDGHNYMFIAQFG
jgi:hypothetical protein